MNDKKLLVEEQIISIKECFSNLGEAWNRCLEIINRLDLAVDINDFICGYENQYTYPFDKSFDEIPVHEWIESISFMCDIKIKKLKKDELMIAKAKKNIKNQLPHTKLRGNLLKRKWKRFFRN